MDTKVLSPNTQMMPVSSETKDNHLWIGGCDTTDLAKKFGTPLWVMDYATVEASASALKQGLSNYPNSQALYAGKAFMCLALCKLTYKLGLGLDVVSEGELYTALKAGIPAKNIYMHGNNKSKEELKLAVENPGVTAIVDGLGELELLIELAKESKKSIDVMVRVTPGVEPDTHEYIKTGQEESKFGISLDEVIPFIRVALNNSSQIKFTGLHAHIGSQSLALEPYLKLVDVMAQLAKDIKSELEVSIEKLNLGGGLGIVYVEENKPLPLYDWSKAISARVVEKFPEYGLALPKLLVEPGRAIVGSAGVTLYSCGQEKTFQSGKKIVAVDGGMADNPRPATYNALYTACLANRMDSAKPDNVVELVGRYCESGDIIIKDAQLPAQKGDLVAVFASGAYHYSMASNYNRTARPACVLVKNGVAELIVKRESLDDLIRQDLIPSSLD